MGARWGRGRRTQEEFGLNKSDCVQREGGLPSFFREAAFSAKKGCADRRKFMKYREDQDSFDAWRKTKAAEIYASF